MAGFMRVNHKLVYAGVFLVGIGGVLVASDLGSVANDTLVAGLRLWPVAIIAVGLGLALRKTRISFGSGMLAAAVPGLLLGGAFAAAPRFAGDCGAPDSSAPPYVTAGSFADAPVAINVTAGCGSLDVGIGPDPGSWQLIAGSPGAVPRVASTPGSLSISPGGSDDWHLLGNGRDAWHLKLPWAIPYDSIDVEVNANRAELDLTNGNIRRLALTGRAAIIHVNAATARLDAFDARIELGELRLELPDGDVTATIRLAGGRTLICAPPGVGIRATFSGQLRDVTINGLKETGTNWESADYETAQHHASVSVRADVGGIEINPIGGCS